MSEVTRRLATKESIDALTAVIEALPNTTQAAADNANAAAEEAREAGANLKNALNNGTVVPKYAGNLSEKMSPDYINSVVFNPPGVNSSVKIFDNAINGHKYHVSVKIPADHVSQFALMVSGAWDSFYQKTQYGEYVGATINITKNNDGIYMLAASAAVGHVTNADCYIYDITGVADFDASTMIYNSPEISTSKMLLADSYANSALYAEKIVYDNGNLPTERFVNGALVNGIINRNWKSRVSSDYKFRFPFPINIFVDLGYRFGVQLFNDDGSYDSDSGWITSNYIVEKNKLFMLTISAVQEDTSIVANIDDYVGKLTAAIPDPEKQDVYYGDVIKLDNNTTIKQWCDFKIWKDFKGTEIQDLANYELHLNQSMAIYNDYVFLFTSSGICTVLNYSTKGIINKCTFEPLTDNHANSAQFTDYFYSNDDEFPLLLLSRCGNSSWPTGHDECLIYRVTRTSSQFTLTLINDINIDFTTYGASWTVDLNSRVLYMSSYINGTWQVTQNNPIKIRAFDLPSKNSILSGTEIVLSENDVIAEMEIPHYTNQSILANGGIIYIGMSGATGIPQSLWAVDFIRNRVKSKVPVDPNYEMEGSSIYNGKMYVSQVINTDTQGTNPCKIYELSF